jgi:hypothetical protein
MGTVGMEFMDLVKSAAAEKTFIAVVQLNSRWCLAVIVLVEEAGWALNGVFIFLAFCERFGAPIVTA